MSRPFRLEDIINPPSTKWYENQREYAPVYKKKYYIDDLRKNYREWGLDEKRVDEIDKIMSEYKRNYVSESKETLNIEKLDELKFIWSYEGDKVNIKIDASLYDMYNDYISKGVQPPVDLQVKAYKSAGASDEYIENFMKKIERKKKYATTVDKLIEKVFDKEQKKPAKKKKVVEKEPEEEEIIEQEEDEEDEQEEEGEELIDEDAENDEEDVQEEEMVLDED